ncbi:uncharacterized protein [Chelonus insularis]|uniref:uncharacterized protein isoform X2 n=1 Tax=Chelonus insularis TaxID=460826 RepID=UPI00158EF096|nr:uncharacterized protein LOC118067218 isoform X2 [Chelonus insularis]
MVCTRDSCAYLVLFLILVYSVSGKPSPKPSPWATYKGKPGAPVAPGMDTITVPYIGKSSPFFPKFVDPKMMISKKTGFLSNLFGGVGPVNYPMSADANFFPYVAPKPSIYARSVESEPSQDVSDLKEILGDDKNEESQANEEVKRGIFGPGISPFGPISPWSPQFSPSYGSPFYGSKFEYNPSAASASRKKRSLTSTVTSSPPTYPPPPPVYPGLDPIPEESESTLKTSYPLTSGMFGPFGPYEGFSPAPIIDPGIFIAKKTAFLNKLFSTLATSTPATPLDFLTPKSTIVPPGFWSPFETTTTEVPVPKSTIVPPGFWLPSSVIPSPGEYTQKVATFLDKLFESIKLNKTQLASPDKIARSLGLESDGTKIQVKRSIEDLQTLTAVKDAIVDSIITELASLKTEMVNNMNDLIVSQKMVTTSMSKKPIKPMKTAFAGFWAPNVDYTAPFRQKMVVLSQIFDTLTEIQKNITVAVSEAIKNSAPSTEAPAYDDLVDYKFPNNYLFNVTLLDAVKGKLADLNAPKTDYQVPMPFWMAYAKGATIKRDADNEYKDNVSGTESSDNKDQYKRAVKMSMHQGYQSMPPGTIESVQAGGGSVPGHQGGGIKFFDSQYNNDDWASWSEYINNQYKDHRHHHNHH